MPRLLALSSCLALIAAPAAAQFSVGLGPTAHGRSIGSSNWETHAQLGGLTRFAHPFGSLTFDGAIERHERSFRLRGGSLAPVLATPSRHGFRLIAAGSVESEEEVERAFERRSGSVSLSYRKDGGGAWMGLAGERFAKPAFVTGFWRQLGSRTTVSVNSTIRQASVGGTPSRFWYETRLDSTYTDTAGWNVYEKEFFFGDSGKAATRLQWAETEARVGWSGGRIALDGVVGWRPVVDTARQTAWMRGFATIALPRGIALSAGAGTTTRQLPYMRSTGRFGSLSVRLAPAALLRPKPVPQITPLAAGFSVTKTEAGDYVVRVRVPRARVVELSGDFNSWEAVRLTQKTGDVWEAVLAIAPGTYRMNVRVDGERWIAPPGTAAVEDEFNGRVGLVIVR